MEVCLRLYSQYISSSSIHHDSSTNDLGKATHWCISNHSCLSMSNVSFIHCSFILWSYEIKLFLIFLYPPFSKPSFHSSPLGNPPCAQIQISPCFFIAVSAEIPCVSNINYLIVKLFQIISLAVSVEDSCRLFCQIENHNVYYELASKVIDGTPCRKGSFDVCVEGKCRVSNGAYLTFSIALHLTLTYNHMQSTESQKTSRRFLLQRKTIQWRLK